MQTVQSRPPLVVRVAIVLGGATLVWLAVRWFGDALFGSDYHRGRHVLSAVLITALVVPLVMVAYRRLDRLPWDALRRATPRGAMKLILVGAAAYLIPATLAVTGFLLLGRLSVGLDVSPVRALGSVLALVVLVFFYEALPEELIFRGYLFRNLATALPTWAVVLVQALLFTLFGVAVGAAGSIERVLIFFGFAIVQGILRAVTGSLFVAVGFHLAFQVCEQIVGPHWNLIFIDDLSLLQNLVLGLIPLTLGVATAQILMRRRPAM
ncbi:CPBP family intramembrane glutamic endopeptidase [Actinoplanes solisilvae]|uniref:CPBP family intramembrane glutamic endopeptidase n=1 Tax=Actinoplanes solisilvae TaxID=2486853 RepID=UPI000FD9466D|nr:CPBP family intramembrane glutamic endopeptidase [Actinoplanes solisilvae]